MGINLRLNIGIACWILRLACWFLFLFALDIAQVSAIGLHGLMY